MARPVRVLVVDDSALFRLVVCRGLAKDDGIEVVGTAADAYEARDLLVQLRPDVITLDIDMPTMDGLTFMKKFMEVLPTPTVIVSGLTRRGTRLAVECLEAGAVQVIAKPSLGLAAGLPLLVPELCEAVKAAANTTINTASRAAASRAAASRGRPPAQPTSSGSPRGGVVAIGGSTGGVSAIAGIVRELPATFPPVLIVQHMPAGFTASFAARLDSFANLTVREANDGDAVVPGTVLIAPGGDRHMELSRMDGGLVVELVEGPTVAGHVPSVDVLFRSVARTVGSGAVGVLLTGMGRDGAAGLGAIRRAGGHTLAQDEATSVVYGMPGAAVKLGAAVEIAALGDMNERIEHALARQSRRTP